METVIAAVILIGVIMSAMALCVIFANKPIKGSCGGMATLGFKENCDICGGVQTKCDDYVQSLEAQSLAEKKSIPPTRDLTPR